LVLVLTKKSYLQDCSIDKTGDLSSFDNYRPITVSPIIYKVFECCVQFKFESALESSHLQFGFKNNSSCCLLAIFLLKDVTGYFVNHVVCLDVRKRLIKLIM